MRLVRWGTELSIDATHTAYEWLHIGVTTSQRTL